MDTFFLVAVIVIAYLALGFFICYGLAYAKGRWDLGDDLAHESPSLVILLWPFLFGVLFVFSLIFLEEKYQYWRRSRTKQARFGVQSLISSATKRGEIKKLAAREAKNAAEDKDSS